MFNKILLVNLKIYLFNFLNLVLVPVPVPVPVRFAMLKYTIYINNYDEK